MRTGPDGVLHLGVPVREKVGWALLLVAVAAGGLADLRWGSGAAAIACLVVVVDVPLTCTQVLALPPLRRRLDRQVAALRAWSAAGPA